MTLGVLKSAAYRLIGDYVRPNCPSLLSQREASLVENIK